MLPPELYKRPKKGFDLPLLKWFRNELHKFIFSDLLSEKNIEAQGIFEFKKIREMQNRLQLGDAEDITEQLWALIVFQYWYKKYIA